MEKRQIITKPPADLFEGSAYYYARFQAEYPKDMFDYFSGNYLLDAATDELLDLGCGTGQFAVPLARFARNVTAIDPDEDMITEARLFAKNHGVNNVSFLVGKSEELPANCGPFSLVTIGGAFHWMNREQVLIGLDEKVSKTGVIAIISRLRAKCEPTDWWAEQLKYIEEFWGGFFPVGKSGIRPTLLEDNSTLLSRSAFNKVHRIEFKYEHIWDIDSLMGYILSTSKACPGTLGDRRNEFETGLRSLLLEMSPDRVFIERGVAEVLIGSRI